MILDEIVLKTKERYKDLIENTSILKEEVLKLDKQDYNYFYDALSKSEISFICEIKKASPSKGIISEDFNYLEIAKQYNKCADAISVLTEPYFFKGSNQILEDVKKVVDIPVLRKDFILYEYEIYESRKIGANGILLIVAILDSNTLKKYITIAHSLGLGVIVEAHNQKEIEIALESGAKAIGVNNRDLRDFSVDMKNSVTLRKTVNKDIIFISESGIKIREDIKSLEENGVNAVLIGEVLMKSDNIIDKVRELRYDKDKNMWSKKNRGNKLL